MKVFKISKWKLLYLVPTVLLMLTDCHCQDRRIVVKSVLLEIPTSVAGFAQKLDREKFSELVKSVMEKDAHFHFEAERQGGEVLHLSLIVPTEYSEKAAILLAASLEGGENGEIKTKAFSDIAIEQGRISGNDVSVGVSQVLQSLYQMRSGAPLDSANYVQTIEAASRGENITTGELINAITVVTNLKEKKAEPFLIKLLTSSDSLSIGNACLVALGDMESADAMPAIMEFAERKPPIFRRQAIMAARKIATKEAAEWLVAMAYGHDDPTVRSEAMIALKEVETKLGLPAE